MAVEYLDPTSNIATPWDTPGSFTDINDAVRSPTDAESSGDGNFIFALGGTDEGNEAQFGTGNAVNTGTATVIKLFAYATNGGAGPAISGNVRIANVWQTAAAMSITVEAWYSITYNGSWDMSTLTNMGLSFLPTGLGVGNTNIYAAYLEVTYTAAGGSGGPNRMLSSQNNQAMFSISKNSMIVPLNLPIV